MPRDENHVALKPGMEFPAEGFERSVIVPEKADDVHPSSIYGGVLTFGLASFAESIPEWGTAVRRRDQELRRFWKSEDMLAGAVYSVCTRNSAFEWEVDAPRNTRIAVTNMLHKAQTGKQTYGWTPFIQAFSQDLYTQDNGAFIEIIRKDHTKFDSPVVGIAHLDSNRCQRTGNPVIPVLYNDDDGIHRKLHWWNVIATAEFPSADENMNGVGICAVSRVLRLATILKNIAVFKNEKVSGRFYKQLHFVGGVSRREIDDIKARGEEHADNAGQSRYILPEIIASLDPEKPVSTATIDLASLPDGFDLDIELKWYISGLALGFGVDYQDFAPLPGGNLGTSMQSETLHRKSSGKSPKLFMETLENIFHYYGVLPRNARFYFVDRDLAAILEEEKLRKERSEARAVQVRAGEVTPEVARDIALRQGDITQAEYDKIDPEYGKDIVLPDKKTTSTGADTIGNSQAEEAQKAIALGKAHEARLEQQKIAESKSLRHITESVLAQLKAENERPIVVNVPKPDTPIVNVNVPEIEIPPIIVPEQKQAKVEVKIPPIVVPPAQVDVEALAKAIIESEGEETIEVLERDSQGLMIKAKKTKKGAK